MFSWIGGKKKKTRMQNSVSKGENQKERCFFIPEKAWFYQLFP